MIADLDVWVRANAIPQPAPPPIPPLPPIRRPLPIPDRGGERRSVDPRTLAACHLDDWAEAWAEHLRVAAARLARREGEHDEAYRPRLLSMIEGLRR